LILGCSGYRGAPEVGFEPGISRLRLSAQNWRLCSFGVAPLSARARGELFWLRAVDLQLKQLQGNVVDLWID